MAQLDELVAQLKVAIRQPTTWAAIVTIVLVCDLAQRFQAWHRLRHIKGPFWASLTDLWLIRLTWRAEAYDQLAAACDKYGPLARIAPNWLVCGDPAELRRMWGVRSPWDRGAWFKGFQLDPPNDCTLSMRDNDRHNALRAMLTPGYLGKGITGLHDIIDHGVLRFMRLLDDKYLSADTDFRPVDIARKVQFMTLDIISEISFGDAFGFIDADGDQFGYIQTVEASGPAMSMIALIPWLVSVIQSPLFKAALPKDTDAVGIGKLMGTAKRIVSERYGPNKIDKPDMLGSFVSHGLGQREAEAESLVQIIAGSDTTAAALRAILLAVSTNAAVLAKLRAELDAALAAGRVSTPVITDAEARRLPYLQAVITEGLRCWPPIAGYMPRVCARTEPVCGIPVPPGTNVAWSTRAVMRSKAVFGDDAEMYRPARWIVGEGPAENERLSEMQNTVDLCFGHGRWGCLGRTIALIELNKMVAELLRRYDFVLANPAQGVQTRYYGVLMQKGMIMRVTKREQLA